MHPMKLHSSRPRSRGISLIEIMVGLVLGLLIVAGASSLLLTDMLGSRRMRIEAKLEQDLRSAMDMVTRDLRRGGYWSSDAQPNLTANPHTTLTLTDSPPVISYSYSRNGDDTLNTDEQFRFRLDTGTGGTGGMELELDGGWLAMTDTETMQLDRANSSLVALQQDGSDPSDPAFIDDPITLDHACPTGCATACQIRVRAYRITLVGVSTADTAVTRTLTSTVRVRNDAVEGSCNP